MDIPKPLTLSLAAERWPIAGSFTISRGAKTEAVVVVVELADGTHRGRGECVPYSRYGESIESVSAQIEAMRRAARRRPRPAPRCNTPCRPGRRATRSIARSGIWKPSAPGVRCMSLPALPAPQPLTTAFTISLASPADMAKATAKAASRALLKIKLGAPGDAERIAAVRAAAPATTLIVDANEGWDEDNLAANLAACAKAGVVLVEQPLPEGRDGALARIKRPIPVCADESAHDLTSLPALAGRYDAVNVKLDKAGGLTEALKMAAEAERLGFTLMLGSMVATSLSVAPAMLVAQKARFVDLDGPLLLARDRPNGLLYRDSLVYPATPALWG